MYRAISALWAQNESPPTKTLLLSARSAFALMLIFCNFCAITIFTVIKRIEQKQFSDPLPRSLLLRPISSCRNGL